ncbi:hypothetical protein [Hymenobacter sp. B1770]|uniref:hypothetical protein n=1 Tax=Hymenobacter sp. B1770 TaxID=1718788 RepID=UPI003CEEDB51
MNTPDVIPKSFASVRIAQVFLAGFLTVSVVLAFITESTFDSGDSIKHFLFARDAFQYPMNYLDSWAKPLFTLLASGPAQAGFIGMKLFQCGVVALSAWCAFVVARALGLPAPYLAIVFAYAAPDYFLIQYSGLTEPLFGLVLVGAVALAVTHRPGWSAALISWLPFVRSEGFIIIGVWAVYLMVQRQWKLLPLLLLGYAVFSAVGAVVLGDASWVFGHNPYATVSVYGHGVWDHFLDYMPNLLGRVLWGLALIGAARMVYDSFQRERRQTPLFSAELLLVYGSITVFVVAHSIFWAYGLFNSFGLTRVLTVTVPLFAIVALNGLAGVTSVGQTRTARWGIRTVLAIAILLFPALERGHDFAWQRDLTRPPDQQVVENAAAWLRQTYGQEARPLAYEFPYVAVATNNNFFDPKTHPAIVLNEAGQVVSLPVGGLLVWDDWYAPVEGHVQLNKMLSDARFRQLWQDSLPRHPERPERDTTRIIIFERVR